MSCSRRSSQIVKRFVATRSRSIRPRSGSTCSSRPYWGFAIERLVEAIRPDTTSGEAPEVPRYEQGPRDRLHRGRRLLDQQAGQGGHEVAPQLRGVGLKVGAVGRLPPRQHPRVVSVREEPRSRSRDPVPARRRCARVRAGLHRPARQRRAPDPRAQGLRPAQGGQGSGRRAVGRAPSTPTAVTASGATPSATT